MVARADKATPPTPVDRIGPVGLNTGQVVEAPWTDRWLDTSHGRVAIRETWGTGLPLVLLHGNSMSKDAFRRQMDGALGSRHRMVAIDLPGHGASDDAANPEHGYTLTRFADVVVEVAEMLELEEFAILGWSLGGHVALEVCAGAPGILGVMLVGAPAIGVDPASILQAFRPGPFLKRTMLERFSNLEAEAFSELAGVAGDADLSAAVLRADGRARVAVLRDALAGGASDARAIVGTMRVPLAIVDGAEDPIVERSYVDGLTYSTLWEGRTPVIPGVGHAPFREIAPLFNSILARFLADLCSRDSSDFPSDICLAG